MVRQSPRKTKGNSSTRDSSLVEQTHSVKVNGTAAKKGARVEFKVEEVEKKAISKRKSVAESDFEPEEPAEEAKKPAAKKRKTKAGKEDENMPLAARTAISSLKKAMYIGAHVSGAGGLCPISSTS